MPLTKPPVVFESRRHWALGAVCGRWAKHYGVLGSLERDWRFSAG